MKLIDVDERGAGDEVERRSSAPAAPFHADFSEGRGLIFAGRERDLGRITGALAAGRNVIVTGRFGMGRTALLRQAAERMRESCVFVFADFEKTPAGICEELLAGFAEHFSRRGRRSAGYLGLRAALLRASEREPSRCVIALDNIGKVSAPKADLVRSLSRCGRFGFAAVIEGFLPQKDRVRLGAWLEPACRIELGPLAPQVAAAFFTDFAAAHRAGWTPAEIEGLARASAGYPLGMQELARRALARCPGEL